MPFCASLPAVMALGVVNVGMDDLVVMALGMKNVGIDDLVVAKRRVLASNFDRENTGVLVEHVSVNVGVVGNGDNDSDNIDGSVVTVDDVGVVDVVGLIVVVIVVVDAGETMIRGFTGV